MSEVKINTSKLTKKQIRENADYIKALELCKKRAATRGEFSFNVLSHCLADIEKKLGRKAVACLVKDVPKIKNHVRITYLENL